MIEFDPLKLFHGTKMTIYRVDEKYAGAPKFKMFLRAFDFLKKKIAIRAYLRYEWFYLTGFFVTKCFS